MGVWGGFAAAVWKLLAKRKKRKDVCKSGALKIFTFITHISCDKALSPCLLQHVAYILLQRDAEKKDMKAFNLFN